ncbi:hypothetical protein [Pseudoalteromonas rhizosphaerae]|uniref:hypothetical protein n=1 Tax=Pseudoalteromonas rhizosphaerae TaxID=2518973 RepID=UPI00384AD223
MVDRSSQNYFETIIDNNLKEVIVDDIDKITSLDDNQYLSENEIHALQNLCILYCDDITTKENEYEGLRIKEWVRGYSCLIYLVLKSEDSVHGKIYSKAELISLLVKGGIVESKAENF